MNLVLGLSGRAGAGKDTVADFLIEQRGWDKKLAFAYNLKKMCMDVFGLREHQVFSQEGKSQKISPIKFTPLLLDKIVSWMRKTHPITNEQIFHYISTSKPFNNIIFHSPREIIRYVGTNVCRSFIPTYHIDILVKNCFTHFTNKETKIIITDVRFPNEAEALIKFFSAPIIKINRTEEVKENLHFSEIAMSGWNKYDYVINNDIEGVESLYNEVDSFLKEKNIWHV